ncbi:MAG: four helix bundle protein, partial [Thermodesulfobacteriota bacterium]
MPTINRFEDLHCWQDARKLVFYIYALTSKDEFRKDYGLKDQVRRSAISGMANISEGFHRNSDKDFTKFLDYARASLAETISHCYVALDQNYITNAELANAQQLTDITWKR